LPCSYRFRGTRRLQTSAEAVQIATDRIEKVRGCSFRKNTAHNLRRYPKLSSNLTTTKNEMTAKEQDDCER
ncbi:hypothetical protein V1520DRAFT_280712, partial [Lipomyces starkeyi]